jgi:GNAT superfamily N-acetyltransferase
MKCGFCGANAQYRDPHTGEYICLAHSRLQVVAQRSDDGAEPLTVRPAVLSDRDQIVQLSFYFWGEIEVECFGREYDVRELPAFVAWDGSKEGQIVGLASYAVEGDVANLVMLNVLPDYQGRGAGRALMAAVEGAARAHGVARIVVATSNDDLPALYLYQRCGFHLNGIEVGRLVEHHGSEEPGFAGIPVRDEVQLEKRLRRLPCAGRGKNGGNRGQNERERSRREKHRERSAWR